MIRFLLRLSFFLSLMVLILVVITKSLPLPGTIPVFMYRSIGSKEDAKERKYFVSRESFSFQMAFLKFFGYRVISIEEYARILLKEMPSRGREILITFDGGDETFMQEAWPVLQKHQFPAAVFLVSERVKRELPGSLNQADIKELLMSGRIKIGSNSKTHPSLPQTQETQKKEEIAGSKTDLETLFGIPIRYFSYPNGDIDGPSVSAVKEAGYVLGFTTSHHKLGNLEETPFSLTRMNITQSADNPIIFWAKVTGIYQTHKQFWHRFKEGMQHSGLS